MIIDVAISNHCKVPQLRLMKRNGIWNSRYYTQLLCAFRKFHPNFTYMKFPKQLVRRSIQAAVHYTLNFRYHFFSSLLVFPSWAEGGPAGSDRGKAHLNDFRFNSNWVFFTNNDCLKVDIQFQKFLNIPKFGLRGLSNIT